MKGTSEVRVLKKFRHQSTTSPLTREEMLAFAIIEVLFDAYVRLFSHSFSSLRFYSMIFSERRSYRAS